VDRDTQRAIAIPDDVRAKLVTILRVSGEDGA
jgi:hypothetical protein